MISLKNRITDEANRADEAWGRAYPLFCRVINCYGLKIGVEVGVAFGGHAEAILHQTRIEKLYGIDPYKHFDDYDDPMNLSQSEFDVLYEFTVNRLAKFGDRFEAVRETSTKAVGLVNEQIDFVYIDALHTYEGVRSDIINWYAKVKRGGIIGGHDYGHPNFPGVKKAVDEFFSRFGWDVHDEGEGVWWVEKQIINISFFIPAFNCATTIRESVESIMTENFADGDEIVIVDDGSTDNTADVLSDLQKTYDTIKIVRHFGNRGGGAARNTAIEYCRSNILFCLDSDNLLEAGSINNLKHFFENNGADIASFQELHFFINSVGEVTHKWVFRSGIITLSDCLSGKIVPISSGNYLFTKQSWLRAGGYPEFAGALDAWGFGFRQLATGSIMLVLPNNYYFHRHGHESYWIRDSNKMNISLKALQIVLPYIDIISDADVNYLMGSAGRNIWFDELGRKPIRLKMGESGSDGFIDYLEKIPKQTRSCKCLLKDVIGVFAKFMKRVILKNENM